MLFVLTTFVAARLVAAIPETVNLLPTEYHAANKNWVVAEDETGTLYVGNDQGMLEFDGLQWRLYKLPNGSVVRSVCAVSHETIFTGGFEEFGRWDRTPSGELVYTSLVPATPGARLSDSDFWRICAAEGKVLFQSFHEIYVYDYAEVTLYDVQERNLLFLLPAGDGFWVQEMGGAIYRLGGSGLEIVPGSERFRTTTVRVLLPGARPGEWIVGTGRDGLWYYDGRRFREWSPALSELMCRDELNCGIRTSRGTYLFGTLLGGIYETDAEGRILLRLSTRTRLPNDSVMALLEDRSGRVWAALDRGLSRLTFYEGIDFYTYNNWLHGSIYDACRWQGKLLLATNQGVAMIDERLLAEGDARTSDFRFLPGLSGQIWSFNRLDGKLFVCHNSGIVEIRPDFSVATRSAMGGYRLRRIRSGDRTYTFFASYYRLRGFDGRSTWEIEGFDESVYDVETDYMRNLWIEHPSKGVYRCRLSDDGMRIESSVHYGGDGGNGLPRRLRPFRVGERVLFFGDDRFFRYNEYTDRIESDSVLDAVCRDMRGIRRVVPSDDGTLWVIADRNVYLLRYDGSRNAEAMLCAGIPVDNLLYEYEHVARLDDTTSLFCGDNGFELVDRSRLISPPSLILR